MDSLNQIKYDGTRHSNGSSHSLAPGLPAHVASPYSYAAQHSRNNSIVNLVTAAELTADKSIKVQHQHIERVPESADGERNPLDFPNPWSKIRHDNREYFAEFFGTMLLICFGTGVDCQVVLSGLKNGSYLSINVGWGVGVMVGIYVAGGISGGHLNPAVTIALATFRGLSWKKVPGLVFAQVFGAFCGCLIIQGIYSGALNAFEGGPGIRTFGGLTSSGNLLFTAPSPYASNLLIFRATVMVFALSDKNNLPPPPGVAPIVFFFLIFGIGAAFGWNTSYCLNPARDLGGYPGEIFTFNRAYFLWTPIIATTMGGLFGGLLYDVFMYVGDDSWINSSWGSPNAKVTNEKASFSNNDSEKAVSFV